MRAVITPLGFEDANGIAFVDGSGGLQFRSEDLASTNHLQLVKWLGGTTAVVRRNSVRARIEIDLAIIRSASLQLRTVNNQ